MRERLRIPGCRVDNGEEGRGGKRRTVHDAADRAGNSQVALQAEREMTPREQKIQDARNTNATAARIQVVMAEVATSEPAEAEKPLISELKEQHGVYRLLQKTSQNDKIQQLGLRMPWESRGIKTFQAPPQIAAGQRSRPTYNLNLSAQIGGEQLASIRREAARKPSTTHKSPVTPGLGQAD